MSALDDLPPFGVRVEAHGFVVIDIYDAYGIHESERTLTIVQARQLLINLKDQIERAESSDSNFYT